MLPETTNTSDFRTLRLLSVFLKYVPVFGGRAALAAAKEETKRAVERAEKLESELKTLAVEKMYWMAKAEAAMSLPRAGTNKAGESGTST
jgi:hypothetical protein